MLPRTRASVLMSVMTLTFAGAIGCDSNRPLTAPLAAGPRPSVPVEGPNVARLVAPPSPPSSATDPVVGRYSLEVAASGSGSRCEAFPSDAKRRTYTADIEDLGGRYAVKLYDASFLRDASPVGYGCQDRRLTTGGICHQFLMERDGISVSVTISPEDEWRGSEIWEVLPDGHLLAINGHATGVAGDERIEVSGSGSLWYGDGIPSSAFLSCEGDLHLTFTRR